MKKLKVGLVGWRGLVGSVLLERFNNADDLKGLQTTFFSTSAQGQELPQELGEGLIQDARDLACLMDQDVLISCQGGEYTKSVYPELRKSGWSGYWIDAASTLRMNPDSVIVLDPVNGQLIKENLAKGGKLFVGGNCTVSLMLMALSGLFQEKLIEWVSSMTYQAVSGAGAKQMTELMQQMNVLGTVANSELDRPAMSAIRVEAELSGILRHRLLPCDNLGLPIAGSLFPWIDSAVEGGQTREEWKGHVEANKILGDLGPVVVDGLCVRVGVLRCHSQAILLKLRKEVQLETLSELIANAHEWAEVIPNDREHTSKFLTPAAVTGTLKVPVGRLHFSRVGKEYVQLFTVGDQLLWGAAEPLRRTLLVIREYLGV